MLPVELVLFQDKHSVVTADQSTYLNFLGMALVHMCL